MDKFQNRGQHTLNSIVILVLFLLLIDILIAIIMYLNLNIDLNNFEITRNEEITTDNT